MPRGNGLPPLPSWVSPKPQAAIALKRGLGMTGPLHDAFALGDGLLLLVGHRVAAQARLLCPWTGPASGCRSARARSSCVSMSMTSRKSLDVAVARVYPTLIALAIMVAEPRSFADGGWLDPATATPATSAMIAITTKISISVSPRLLALWGGIVGGFLVLATSETDPQAARGCRLRFLLVVGTVRDAGDLVDVARDLELVAPRVLRAEALLEKTLALELFDRRAVVAGV